MIQSTNILSGTFTSFYLVLDVREGGEERHKPDSLQVRRGEVLVQLAEVVHGQGEAQHVDEDPEEVEHVMTIRTLQSFQV